MDTLIWKVIRASIASPLRMEVGKQFQPDRVGTFHIFRAASVPFERLRVGRLRSPVRRDSSIIGEAQAELAGTMAESRRAGGLQSTDSELLRR